MRVGGWGAYRQGLLLEWIAYSGFCSMARFEELRDMELKAGCPTTSADVCKLPDIAADTSLESERLSVPESQVCVPVKSILNGTSLVFGFGFWLGTAIPNRHKTQI